MPSAYIETTIPSYYVARTSLNLLQASRQASTRMWWDGGCSGLNLFTSLEVIDEAGEGEEEMARLRLGRLGSAQGRLRCYPYCGSIRARDELPCDMEFQAYREPFYAGAPSDNDLRIGFPNAGHV